MVIHDYILKVIDDYILKVIDGFRWFLLCDLIGLWDYKLDMYIYVLYIYICICILT